MGQTLTYGVYLPDEGERNCYSGLANNWQILDDAVGAIAGKANASHTHGNITNAGAIGSTSGLPVITGTDGVLTTGTFGDTAGTFCEGNDSRLSDARTPLAHTHVTADVTDLLNTTHEWTKEQVCDEGFTAKSTTIERCVTPASVQHVNFTFKDKNGRGFGAIRRYFRNSGEQQIQIFGNTRIKDGQYDETGSDEFFGFSEVIKPDGTKYFSFDGYLNNSIRPRLTDTYQLGDSSYQWNSVYAKNYYYNGVAWGLDKANVWSKDQSIVANANHSYIIKNTSFTIGEDTPSSDKVLGTFIFKDSTDTNIGFFNFEHFTNGNVVSRWLARYKYTNGVKSTTGSTIAAAVDMGFDNSGNKFLQPITNADTDLGTSTNKWKTLNGVNPGALSLPKIVAKNTADISGDIVGSDNQQHLDGSTDNNYTASVDGWISICISGFVNNELWITVYDQRNETWGTSAESSTRNNMFIVFPIRANQKMRIRMKCTSLFFARFYPCEGNV